MIEPIEVIDKLMVQKGFIPLPRECEFLVEQELPKEIKVKTGWLAPSVHISMYLVEVFTPDKPQFDGELYVTIRVERQNTLLTLDEFKTFATGVLGYANPLVITDHTKIDE